MGVDHLGGTAGMRQEVQRQSRETRRNGKQTIQHASIGRAGIRVYDGGWIRIEDGGLAITGSQTVYGRLQGDGVFDWTGPVNLRGAQSVTGPTTFTGTLVVNGAWDLNGNGDIAGDVNLSGDLNVLSGGRIAAGPVIIDRGGSYGGRVYSSGTLLLDASGNIVLGANAQVLGTFHAVGDLSTTSDLSVLGSSTVLGAKSFRMPHPLKDEHWLQHGCTESPISGTEYTGRITISEDGSATVELPDYFEALNKARNRTVQVTPIGRPFMVGAEDVVDGKTVVYGEPGREVFWLVKAERTGGDFETEAPIPPAPVMYD